MIPSRGYAAALYLRNTHIDSHTYSSLLILQFNNFVNGNDQVPVAGGEPPCDADPKRTIPCHALDYVFVASRIILLFVFP